MGYSKSVTLSFMLAGHTKFAPDRFFGLIKKVYWHTKVEAIGCIAQVVQNSSVVGAIVPQLMKGQSGDWEVIFYDWTSFFQAYFKDLKGITSYIFHVTSDHRDTVFLRQHSQIAQTQVALMKKLPQLWDFPQQIMPEGLDLKRQWHLREKIRPFCSSTLARDLTCLKPTESKPSTLNSTKTTKNSTEITKNSTKTTKNLPKMHGKRLCSLCQQPGHTKLSEELSNWDCVSCKLVHTKLKQTNWHIYNQSINSSDLLLSRW